ncbi:putative toxin-antitoxin system, antitoxin component, ribbon-helix-helix domain protein [delta proteobacterium NaphS2]|nr:putative toxin-antitoxin system, antitoxin component, ribbon-helix-helix domain protein [delta proteobacterium NaphS2]
MATRRQTSIKVDPKAWDAAKIIFEEYNLTVTDAINIFLNRVRLERGLPFPLKIPSERLKEAMGEAENDELVRYNDIEEMMTDLKS